MRASASRVCHAVGRWGRAQRQTIVLSLLALVLFGCWLGLFVRLIPAYPRRVVGSKADRANVVVGISHTGHRLATCAAEERHLVNSSNHSRHTSGNRQWLPFKHGPVRVWDTRKGRMNCQVPMDDGTIDEVALSADGQFVAVLTSYGLLQVMHVESEEVWRTKAVTAEGTWRGLLQFSSDGEFVACSGCGEQEHVVQVWETKNLKERLVLKDALAPFAFTQDCRSLAVLTRFSPKIHHGPNQFVIGSWSPHTGMKEWSRISPFGYLPKLQFTTAGTVLAIQTLDGTIMVDVATKRERFRVPPHHWLDTSGGEIEAIVPPLHENESSNLRRERVPLEPYRQVLAPSRTPDPSGRFMFRPETYTVEWEQPWKLFAEKVLHLVPDEKLHHRLFVKDLWTRARLGVIRGNGPYIISGDGNVLAMQSEDGVQIWDLPPRRPVLVFFTLAAVPTIFFTLACWWRLGR